MAGRALLLTGVYGSGKSTVAAEIADILDSRREPYAAIDLDWLAWANVREADHDDPRLLVRNLASVVANDREAGVASFVLAGSVGSAQLLRARADDLATALDWIATGHGVGLEDAVVFGVGRVREVAERVLEAAGWS